MERGSNWWRIAQTLMALAVGGVFITAAVIKIADPAKFAQNIKYYHIVPDRLINAMALLLPWWELLAGFAIVVPNWRRAGAWMMIGFLVMFMLAIGSAMARGLDIDCGCFGSKSSKAGMNTLLFDASLLAATIAAMWKGSGPNPPPVIAEPQLA